MPDTPAPGLQLLAMVNGYQLSQAISTAAELRLADALADGPRSAADVAAVVGAHPEALHRLLSALASAGLFRESEDGLFELTGLGQPLRSNVPGSVRGWAEFVGRPYHRAAWAHLPYSIRTDEIAFNHLHGMSVWTYRERNPEESAIFDAAMQSLTGIMLPALLESYDFDRFRRLADLGGGNGTLLAAILARYHRPRGVLFDLAHVVAGSGPVFDAAGVAHRCEAIPGSLFESVPPGCDGYMLKSVIHDCTDGQSIEILARCRAAIGPDASVLVIERPVPAPNEGAAVKFSDLNMMVNNGGRERTRDEYAMLFSAAGLEVTAVVEAPGGWAVIEGRPRP